MRSTQSWVMTCSSMSTSTITEDQVREALKQVPYPGFSRDIVSFGLVKAIQVDKGSDIKVLITLQTRDANVPKEIFQAAKTALHAD